MRTWFRSSTVAKHGGCGTGRWSLASVALAFALATAGIGVAVSLTWPMARDQGIFAWVGDVILQGGVPYRDAWDLKGPSVYLQAAGLQALLGRNMWGIRVADVAVMAVGAWAVCALASQAAGRVAGLWAVAFLLIPYIATGYWNTAQPDGWAAMLGIGALTVIWRVEGPAWLRGGLSGLILGFVSLYKPPLYVVFPVLLLAGVLIYRRQFPSPEWLALALSFIGGILLSVGTVIGWLAVRGGLGDAWNVLVTFNSSLYAHAQPLSISWFGRFLQNIARPEYVLAVVGLMILHRRDRALARLLMAWMTAGLLVVAAQTKMYAYHWHIVIPVVGVGAGIAAAWTFGHLSASRYGSSALSSTKARNALILAAFMILTLVPYATMIFRWTHAVTLPAVAGGTRAYYYDGIFGGAGDFSLSADLQVADYLREHTQPSDTVFIWGLEPLVYYVADRRAPTRYGFRYPITASLAGAPSVGRPMLERLLSDLENAPPTYFIVVDNDLNNLQLRTSRDEYLRIKQLTEFMASRYTLETTLEDFELWRLKSDGYRSSAGPGSALSRQGSWPHTPPAPPRSR